MSLNDFELHYILGKGASGVVWKCVRKITGNVKAIKIIEKADIVCDKSFSRVMAERTIMSKLNNPFITTLHYVFQGEAQIYFVMELVGRRLVISDEVISR